MAGSRARPTRVFYAADIHGSQVTFRKFLAAATFYDVDALVFGGDLMGKALVPILRRNGGYRASFQERDEAFDADGLDAFTRAVEQPGFYWRVFDRDEYEVVESDPLARAGVFHELASSRLADWLALAEDRLRGSGVRLFMTGGNDDEPAVLQTLDRHDGEQVVASEGRLVDLDEEHTMITVGLSTPTPWDTPREASEEEIAASIEAAAAEVPDVSRCVFNLHCPPKDTPIDTCLKLEVRPGELPRPIREAGRFVTTGGGSDAVREAIERYQPLVGLHGHIHESGGRFRIGRTQTFNPGSEYAQGVLQGVIVTLRDGRLASYQHTQG
ncbi:MAG TPA: metallophosphoesterase [Actinomycetota bacterium]|nr:metallophosphoesterase [Actinomycetota bacterium]